MSKTFSVNIAGATPLAQEELDDLIPETITTQEELNEWEQRNILEANTWAFSKKHRDILSTTFICVLHKRMFDNVWKWAGHFRNTNKNIGIDWTEIRIELKKLCDDCSFWLDKQTYSIDGIAARFHHRLVKIHPFPNGNGRHARLIADLILVDAGAVQFSWGGGIGRSSDDEIREEYLECLRAADGGNFSPLLKFVRS
ncbi:MAG: mobile mystery protein B [Candidatus Marinimicrobia bacterium]|nr:mobile mystery protein B [Candidatus Neomarinimicrobiota bacterium]